MDSLQIKKLRDEMISKIQSMNKEELQGDVDEFNRKRKEGLSRYVRDYIIDDSYFKWRKSKSDDELEVIIDNLDYKMVSLTEGIMSLLANYSFDNHIRIESLQDFYVEYEGEVFHFWYDHKNDIFTSYRTCLEGDSKYLIHYEDFRKYCKKNMNDNFMKLPKRISDGLYCSDTERINSILSKLDKPTLTSGVGGSSVVADFASKVLSSKNGIITRPVEPRDFLYGCEIGYSNVLSCSYSGSNYGVDLSFNNDLEHYLLSAGKSTSEKVTNLTYYDERLEKSFISLGGCLLPCAILLNYYLGGKFNSSKCFEDIPSFDISKDDMIYEIFSGFDTSTASKYLESTIVESGIGIPIIHDKYSYCHGRCTFSTSNRSSAIYFSSGTDFDKLMLGELDKYFENVIVLNYSNSLESEFKLLVDSMHLSKQIAESKHIDLSGVEYGQLVRKLYKYNGTI